MSKSGYELVNKENGLIRVIEIINNKSKWGLKNNKGQQILPTIYDYVDTPLNNRLYKVFQGSFEWDEFDDETEDLFYDFIADPKSWNGDQYKGTLMNGSWGIVNETNEEVIPTKYNSLYFHSDSILIVNVNGSRIIKWYCGDEKVTKWSVVGGTWFAITLEGTRISEMNCNEQEFDFYNSLNKLQPWDAKYNNQTVSAYFKN